MTTAGLGLLFLLILIAIIQAITGWQPSENDMLHALLIWGVLAICFEIRRLRK